MAELKFCTKGNGLEQRAIKEVVRGYQGTFGQDVKPSTVSDQDVIVTLTFSSEKLPGKIYHNAQGMAQSRAIRLIGGN